MKKNFIIYAIMILGLASACQTSNSGQTSNNNAGPVKTSPAGNDNKVNKPVEKTAAVKVYDGRKDAKDADTGDAKVSAAELSLVKAEVKKREAQIKKQVDIDCDDGEEVTVVSSIAGAFTKTGARQKLYLYELCRAGRSFGIGGMIVTEGEQIVAHQAYGENGLEMGAEALSDINKNGLSEVLLVGGGTGQGYTEGGISIFEFKNGNLDYWGGASTYSDNSGAVEDDSKIKTTASNITAEPSANPVFYQEVYEKTGEKGEWKLQKKQEKLSLEKGTAPKWVKIM